MNNEQRKGDWMQLFSGRQFWPLDPRPEDITLIDIAHALSLICRFGGHCTCFYSVAQHSVHVHDIVARALPQSTEVLLGALLHDAAEAYIGDMVRPLKSSFPEFSRREAVIWNVIAEAFEIHLAPAGKMFIKDADDIALMTERRDLVNHQGIPWSPIADPDPANGIRPLGSMQAEKRFLFTAGKLLRIHPDNFAEAVSSPIVEFMAARRSKDAA